MFRRLLLLLLSIFMLSSCSTGGAGKHLASQSAENQSRSSGQVSHEVTFRTPDMLDNHYQKHVLQQKEFGNITKDQYLKKAQSLVSQKEARAILVKKNTEGDTLFFDRATNEFAVLSKDGFIRTFFKPQEGIAYFNKQ